MRDWTEDQITLALIRHGETQANKERRYLGKTDEALSAGGKETLLSYKARKRYPDVDYLFASPMKRCMETAEILYPGLRPIVVSEWEEIDFGRFEYRNYEELKDDTQYQAWIDSGGTLPFPGGESRGDFILRCRKGMLKMYCKLLEAAGQNANKPIRAGAIVHGGNIMALLSAPGGTHYFDYQVSNGAGYLCRIERHSCRDKQSETSMHIRAVAEI